LLSKRLSLNIVAVNGHHVVCAPSAVPAALQRLLGARASKRRPPDLFSEFSFKLPAAEHVAAIAGSKSVSGTYRTYIQSRASLDERGAS
jgi:hypothetical protein